MKSFTAALLAASALLAPITNAIPTISVKGAKFFDSTGAQFYIKGIAYQLTEDDPLADGAQCQRDVELMKTIGTNAVRVYHVDPSANHDTCMGALSAAGIYVFLDVDTFDTYIKAGNLSWTPWLFSRYTAVIDAFHGYDNVAGFFVGNEDINQGNETISAPYTKAAARDLKAYQKQKGYRQIPIGYSASDIPSLRPNLQNYFACGADRSAALDFFSLNAYEWCGQNTYQGSGYAALNEMNKDLSIPIFFSETGCNTVQPRTFEDQNAILGPDMDSMWSGAMIYEWIEETNNYGLISYGPPAAATATGSDIVAGFTRQGTPTPIQPDFSNLQNVWKTLSPSGIAEAAYTPSLSPPACPAYTADTWLVSGDAPLPTLGQSAIAAQASAAGTGPNIVTTGGSSSGSGSGSSGGAQATGGSSSSSKGAAAAMYGRRAPMGLPASESTLLVAFAGVVGFVLSAVVIL